MLRSLFHVLTMAVLLVVVPTLAHAAGGDDVGSMPDLVRSRLQLASSSSGGSDSGTGGTSDKRVESTWVKVGEEFTTSTVNGEVYIKNLDTSENKVKVVEFKTGEVNVHGKNGAHFVVDNGNKKTHVDVGANSISSYHGNGGEVNLAGGSTVTVTNTGGDGATDITVNHPSGGKTTVPPGVGPITVTG